jgi:acetylglutamate kinase
MTTEIPGTSNTDKPLLLVVKVGGNIIDDDVKLKAFLKEFASLAITGESNLHIILVHGGGKIATQMAASLGIKQQLVDGRRITDGETLKIVTMVYAGLINKNIVAQLQQNKVNAIGLSGADANLLRAHKRGSNSSETGAMPMDYGFVGDIDEVNVDFLSNLLNGSLTPVIAPITHDGNGQLLNTNADTIAREIATALSTTFNVSLVYTFEKAGVLTDPGNDSTLIKEITEHTFNGLLHKGTITGGMIPKLHNALEALHKGVNKVLIGRAEELTQLIKGETGTAIVIK